MLKPVVQEEKTGCGIACVATLAGITYSSSKKVANRQGIYADDSNLWSNTEYVKRLCASLNIRVAAKKAPFKSWKSLPDYALLAIKWHIESGTPFWHWTVFVREGGECYVLDPKKGLKTNLRTDFGRIKPKWFIKVFL